MNMNKKVIVILINIILMFLMSSCFFFERLLNKNNIVVTGMKILNGDEYYWTIRKFDKSGNELEWNTNSIYSDNGISPPNSIIIDSDNNVYIGGAINNVDNLDVFIKKFDSDGNEDTNWNVSIDIAGLGYDDDLSGLVIDNNNNIYAIGNYDVDGTGTDMDLWIKKYDINGNELEWNTPIIDLSSGNDESSAIDVDNNNNIYVVGAFTAGSSNTDLFIKKFDSNGVEDTTNWDKTFDGNNLNDKAYDIAIDSNNNVYVVGYTNKDPDDDWLIKKFNSNGEEDTTNWNKIINNIGGEDVARSIAIDSNNNIYVSGYTTLGDGTTDWLIKKFDSNGKEIKDITKDWKILDWNFEIYTDRFNNVYSAGVSMIGEGELFGTIVKFDNDMNVIWEKVIKNDGYVSINMFNW